MTLLDTGAQQANKGGCLLDPPLPEKEELVEDVKVKAALAAATMRWQFAIPREASKT